MKTPALTVLSYGGGQDSTAILLRLINDPAARAEYAPGRLIVVMSDTGDEHPETYAHVERTKEICAEAGLDFFHLTSDLGFHGKNWQSLRGAYRAYNACGSKAFPKTCTDRLKVQPIFRFLEDYIGREFGVETGRKKGFYQFADRFGNIRVLLGISMGEEKRVGAGGPLWMTRTIDRVYPLIDWKWDRLACQDYIRSTGVPVPPPSNCILCPFKSEIEVLWTARKMPADMADWIQIEANKLEAHKEKGDKNLGVFGRRTLPEVLKKAEEKYGHMSLSDLEEYRMSHGHCVKSNY